MNIVMFPCKGLSRFVGSKALFLAGMVLSFLAGGIAHAHAHADDAAPRLRRPVALAVSRDGGRLFVANERSGSLSVVDTGTARVVAEHDVGRGLSDVAALPDGRHLLVVDRTGDALLLLEMVDNTIRPIARRSVDPDPVTVVVAPDGGSCVVASLWSRRLTFVELAGPLTVTGTLDLPFSPRRMVLVREGAKLVVADTFGGKLAVVDRERRALESVRTLPAHNIRGLALAPDGRTLVVAHQTLSRSARTDFEDIHWGRLLRSQLRSLRVEAVLAPGSDADLLRKGTVIDLGATGSGAADPSGLACGPTGVVAVALGGVDELAIGRGPVGYFQRFGVGAHPTALAFGPEGKVVYVADTFGDTVSVVDVASGRRVHVISLGRRPEPTLAERGERLFYDARLSHDNWMSCHTCHTDGHTNGLLGDTLGDGSYGAPKRIPSLLGARATGPWTWTGSIDRLEDQVRKSVAVTMWGPALSAEDLAALTAYVRTLERPRLTTPTDHGAASARGREVFRSKECAECHAPPEYTSSGRYDVGLVDESGQREFNPPSLRGVGRRESFLHDGRAATLEDVFLKHRHPLDTELTPGEVADLAAFLRSL
jgi:YVTN family beta-propeller protein